MGWCAAAAAAAAHELRKVRYAAEQQSWFTLLLHLALSLEKLLFARERTATRMQTSLTGVAMMC